MKFLQSLAYWRYVPSRFDGGSEHATWFWNSFLVSSQLSTALRVSPNLLQEVETDQNFMEGITTGDKTWVYCYDPETKRKSCCGSRPSLQNRRNCVSCVPKWKSCWLFLTWKDLFILRPPRSNSESTSLCWGSEAIETRRLLQEAKEKRNLACGLCIRKMHRRTKPTGFRFFFKENHGFPVVQQPPFSPVMVSCASQP